MIWTRTTLGTFHWARATYTDILALSTAAEAVALLNTDASTFYSILNTQWHIVDDWVANEAWTGLYNWTDWTAIYNNWAWEVGAKTWETRTFTITYTESSSPAFSYTYSDDAVGKSWTDFDEFFGYYPVILDGNGNEFRKLNMTDFTKDIDWNDVTSYVNWTNWDYNVMIAFPKRWIKMSKSWSQVTLSITWEDDKDWYQYHAFDSWTWTSHNTNHDTLYIWAYEAYANWTSTTSWIFSQYNKTPSSWTWMSLSWMRDMANNKWSWWSIMRWYARQYVNALYMMKYHNWNSQATIWNGIVSSSKQNTWLSNSMSTSGYPTGWSTANQTSSMRLFWLENWWGNLYEWCAGIKTTSSSSTIAYVALGKNTDDKNVTGTTWWKSMTISWASPYYMSAAAGTNDGMFMPIASSWSDSTYYADYSFVDAGYIARVGGGYGAGSYAGAFCLYVSRSPTSASDGYGSRLVYLK